MKRITIPKLLEKYRKGEKLTMITAYDATIASLVDEAGIDMILIGDSLGMVIQGHDTTIPVTMEDIIYHTRCVSRGSKKALIVADLPFMSYQVSKTKAMLAAGRALKEGCANAVKLEGSMEMVETTKLLTAAGIPVISHIGLKPQNINVMGGYKIHGKSAEDAKKMIEEAKAFEEAGAFALLLEGVAVETAREITETVSIPTIGISSGLNCSGQVLVIYDLLGFNPSFNPKFLKVYADGHRFITDAVRDYIEEVKLEKFPSDEHSFHRK
ncbi:MAG: 3-methyl-2-oxobutanoate hydroxymethyltransferase [Deltaproteobacteria bacterium]|jgi:3-methyl-2-oxobutanoate hydroxymethyltransferase|nr:3-methyl-2-oxobutanoate hydroxymethyltransferase [Deltaproteobacteria bacterium]